ncbi:hypothetical protein M5119_13960 [Lacticaseibacillus paracasei]|nr:hypothetical protein [Lacticaseibacillus paracasei]MCL4970767.1 hypothetical protein [Lacticaseibacillus paracasei]
MIAQTIFVRNYSIGACIDDSELAESQGGIGVVATGVIIGSLTVFLSGVFSGFTDGMTQEKKPATV